MDIVTIISGIIGIIVGFGIVIEKSNISNYLKNAKKKLHPF
jgi:hypothetical protein